MNRICLASDDVGYLCGARFAQSKNRTKQQEVTTALEILEHYIAPSCGSFPLTKSRYSKLSRKASSTVMLKLRFLIDLRGAQTFLGFQSFYQLHSFHIKLVIIL